MPAALANGSIAGYIVAEPFNAAAEVMEVGKILRFTGGCLAEACLLRRRDERGRPRAAAGVGPERGERAGQSAALDEGKSEEAARLLSAEGYLPQPLAAIERALTHYDHEHYGPSGAIRHPEWGSARIDFVPYPYPSYTEALVRFLQDTYVEGERAFLTRLDPKEAHGRLVDDTFCPQGAGPGRGTRRLWAADEWTRTEVISL